MPFCCSFVVFQDALKHRLYLIVNILCGKSEFLVKHLVRSRETETFQTEHLSVASNESLKVYRKACCKTEDLCPLRKYALLIFLALIAEETL